MDAWAHAAAKTGREVNGVARGGNGVGSVYETLDELPSECLAAADRIDSFSPRQNNVVSVVRQAIQENDTLVALFARPMERRAACDVCM